MGQRNKVSYPGDMFGIGYRVALLGSLVVLSTASVGASQIGTRTAPLPPKWDADKNGPLIELVRYTRPGTPDTRKVVTVGKISARVPIKMVTLDTKFSEAPNLYDGLPQEAKALYLLTILDKSQLEKATGDGLTLADCQGESYAVLNSILPNPFKYQMGIVQDHRSIQWENQSGDGHELSDSDRKRIHFCVGRHLELIVALAGNRGYSGTSVDPEMKTGTRVPLQTETTGDSYGHHVRIESANRLRLSQLDYKDSRLDLSIPLVGSEPIQKLLNRISGVTSLELYADPHYTSFQLTEVGKQASIKDLLMSVALCVTGTYRRVGSAYVLTNDLEGIAAHQARLALWEDELDKVTQEREDLWRSRIYKSGIFEKLQFELGVRNSLTKEERENLASNTKGGDNRYIPVGSTSTAVQKALLETSKLSYGDGIHSDVSKVGISSSVRFSMILPDGSKVWNIGWMGNGEQFHSEPYIWQPPKHPVVSLPLRATKMLGGIILRAESQANAVAAVQTAMAAGFSNLWFETHSLDALHSALREANSLGVKITLVIRPWAIGPNERPYDPDRTISGLGAKVLGNTLAESQSWNKFWQEQLAYPPVGYERWSPANGELSAHWHRLTELGKTAGVSQVALMDAWPQGYALQDNNTSYSYYYSNPLDNFTSLGYSEAMRLAFLRAQKADPADFENQMVRTRVSIREAWGESYTNDRIDEWQKAKGKACREAVMQLVNSIESLSVPVLLGGQPEKTHIPPYASIYLWKAEPGKALPISPMDFEGQKSAKNSDAQIITILDDPDPDQRDRVAARVKGLLENSSKPVILDFSSVPSGRWDLVIKRWLKPK